MANNLAPPTYAQMYAKDTSSVLPIWHKWFNTVGTTQQTLVTTQTTVNNSLPAAMPAAIPTVASGTTIAVTTPVVFVSGTTTIQTITPPTGVGNSYQTTIIPTGAFVTGLLGNIALASTAVPNKALIMTYAPATSKWYPSY